MQSDHTDEQIGTAADIAKRLQTLESLASTINLSARNHADQFSKAAQLGLNPLLGYLPGEISGLGTSLSEYDAMLATALESSEEN